MFPSRLVSVLGKGALENNYSLDFDGSNDYVDLGSDMIGDGDVTVSVWIKRTSDQNGRIIANGKFRLQDNVGRTRFSSDAGSTAILGASGDLTLNVWEHIAIARESDGTTNIYVNGSLSGSADQDSGTPASGTQNVHIGSPDVLFSGNIDEVSIWNKVLSAGDISALYQAKGTSDLNDDGNSANLQGWWRMGDGTLDSHPLIADQVNPTLGAELIGDGTAEGSASFPTWEGAGSESNHSYNSTVSNSTDFANGGSKSFKVVNDGGGDGMNIGHLLNESSLAGNMYKATCDVYIPTTDGVDSNITLRMLGSGSEIQVVPDSGTNIALASTRDAWQSLIIYGQYVAHASAQIWNIMSPDTGASEIFYVDNISIKQVNGNPGLMTNMDAVDIVKDTP